MGFIFPLQAMSFRVILKQKTNAYQENKFKVKLSHFLKVNNSCQCPTGLQDTNKQLLEILKGEPAEGLE